jgi:fluoride exporter
MMRAVLLVAAGGAAGSVMRYLTSVFTARFFNGQFFLATFIANILGCLLMGLLMGYLLKNNIQDSELKWLLVTGFCGGYTTFSAFAFENISLFQSQQYATAFLYITASVAVGLAAVGLGLLLTK